MGREPIFWQHIVRRPALGIRQRRSRAISWNTNEIGRLDREYKKALEGAWGLRERAELYPECEGRGVIASGNAVANLGQGDGMTGGTVDRNI